MDTEILNQINDIESLINAECKKHNITPLEPYLLKITPDAFICCIMAERKIKRGIESEQVALFPTTDSPHSFSLLHNAAVCCYYAKEAIKQKPNQAIFLLSAAYYYFGRYCQFNEDIHADKFEKEWNSRIALNRRHEPNRTEKNRVIAHYKNNKSNYPGKDYAAVLMTS